MNIKHFEQKLLEKQRECQARIAAFESAGRAAGEAEVWNIPISDKVPSSLATYGTQLSVASGLLYDSNSDTSLAPHSRSFLLLSSRITSMLTSLEADIIAHQS